MSDRFESQSQNRPEEIRAEETAGAQRPSPESDKPAAARENHTSKSHPSRERRSRRRAMISAPVRVRQLDVTNDGPDEISMTLDVSRGGILFTSAQGVFEAGMEVAVTFPYSRSLVAIHAEQMGTVARVSDMGDGRRAVAIAFTPCKDPEIVDAGGNKLGQESTWTEHVRTEGSERPLVLVMDADPALRACLKTYLKNEGYDVIAAGTAREARSALDTNTPALLIAEIEGDDLPGYDLCAYVKTTPRLQTVPVMLMTRSAYPSDYANAHSLGAIVCMAKPYRQERLGHVVRLLAPPPHAKAATAPPRPADPKRRPCGNSAKKLSQQRIRFVR
ncbi:MAG TPA: response regulator [Candidatus Baltobacteraceae bacterium]|jgi:CheY-like chemotaxis protein|nr:response regulator [Candidatus Baltobacteraceae bacterium]